MKTKRYFKIGDLVSNVYEDSPNIGIIVWRGNHVDGYGTYVVKVFYLKTNPTRAREVYEWEKHLIKASDTKK